MSLQKAKKRLRAENSRKRYYTLPSGYGHPGKWVISVPETDTRCRVLRVDLESVWEHPDRGGLPLQLHAPEWTLEWRLECKLLSAS